MDAFEEDIEKNGPLEIIRGGMWEEYSIEFALGYLIHSKQVVLMSVCLLEGQSFVEEAQGIFDLRFGIRLKYIEREWNVTAMDYSQAAKRRYIHTNNRETVRDIIVKSIQKLATTIKPPQITMSTYDKNLPENAIVKYKLIEECLNGMGYRTEAAYRSDDLSDRWHFMSAT